MDGGKWNLHALIPLKNPNPKKIIGFAKHTSLPGFLFAFAFVFVSSIWKLLGLPVSRLFSRSIKMDAQDLPLP